MNIKYQDISFSLTVPANGKIYTSIPVNQVPINPEHIIAMNIINSGAGWTIQYTAQRYASGYYLYANSLFSGDVPDTVVVRITYYE